MNKILSCITAALVGAAIAHAAEPRTELYYQRTSLFDALGVDSTSIVFLGNSLTHGCEWHELLGRSNVVNRGINGDTADCIASRLDNITAGKPAKIFLLCGVNDVSHDLTADSVATAVETVIRMIRRDTPSTRLYVQSLLPINNSFGRYKRLTGKEQIIRDINTRLRDAAARHGATWIDLYPAFSDSEGNLRHELTNDGLHLMAPGYMIWREILLPYIDE